MRNKSILLVDNDVTRATKGQAKEDLPPQKEKTGPTPVDSKQREPVTTQTVREHLAQTYKLDSDTITHMMQGLKDSMVAELTSAEESLLQNNFPELTRVAHTIKGSLLHLGANSWAKLAEEIEFAARAEEEKDYTLCLQELQAGLAQLLD
jgi:HPt (histidine-containing phosphotransfer) domain-containing protein